MVGIDPSLRRVHLSAANALRLALPNARFLVGDGARPPFEDSAFDLVMAASSIEEADDSAAVLSEMARVLRPGSVVLRASYRDWKLGVPGFESLLLWEGAEVLL